MTQRRRQEEDEPIDSDLDPLLGTDADLSPDQLDQLERDQDLDIVTVLPLLLEEVLGPLRRDLEKVKRANTALARRVKKLES